MGKKTHRFRVHEARRITHPSRPTIEKYWFTVAATDFPAGISTRANARDPVGLNRRVYRDVKDSLIGETASPGTFDLMNKGITILADEVRVVERDKRLFDVVVDDEMGIVDGAHTAKLIEEAQVEDAIPPEQHVEVYIRTGIDNSLVSDIAKGLNTGMQVKPQSIYNIDGVFDWLKAEIKGQPYESLVAWKESDDNEYDVRELICVLEAFNIFDFPNSSNQHPIAAYEKQSIPLDKFAHDFDANRGGNLKRSKYYRLRGILREAMFLHDVIRRDFREIHNNAGGKAGRMKIVEEASERRKHFNFPFSTLKPSKYRLTKGALYPILAAFRNCIEEHPRTGEIRWRGGFNSVLKLWESAGPELVSETVSATKEIGNSPNQIGKSRKHWSDLHKTLEIRLLRQALGQQAAARKNA